jgi:Zn-dependent oligopeptidase
MVAKEERRDYEMFLQFTEYAASFWNYEAVKKIRENRERRKQHAFLSDQEFEKSVKEKEFKNNPWVDRILKMRENNANLRDYSDLKERQRMVKSPTDLSYLASLAEED